MRKNFLRWYFSKKMGVQAAASAPKSDRRCGRNLLERLTQHQATVLAVAFEPGVAFTNNQAERDRSGGPVTPC